MNPVVFWTLAAVAVVSGLFVVGKRSALAGALALAVNLVALAGLFAGLSATFLFIIQILVYAGAVVVLIIFVIMLLNLRDEDMREESVQKGKLAASVLICLLLAAVLVRIVTSGGAGPLTGEPAAVGADFGSVEGMADQLFTRYLIPFEVVSLILLAGIVGAVVIAKRGE
jgi:NADH-quinone oxidoreductase subunit J